MGNPTDGSRGRVLVVDDDPLICEVVSGVLGFAGYSVTTADNEEEALASLETGRPGLALVDARLPVRSDEGLLRRLRERRPAMSVVLMADELEARRLLFSGEADGYLARPFRASELYSAVERWCASA